ncbi:porin family protein [Vibrio splendidus]|nr:porin family protein [Vibrio splendidus]MCC4883089.1 porin family protein [Vibrio splendidus]
MKKYLVAMIALTLSGAAAASVDNVSFGYSDIEDFQAITVSADKSVTENVYVGAEILKAEHKDIASDTVTDINAKVGYIMPISVTHQVYSEVGAGHLVQDYLDNDNVNDVKSDTYAHLEAGIKGDLAAYAPIEYTAFVGGKLHDEIDNVMFVGLDLDAKITDSFAVGVGYKFEKSDSISRFRTDGESQFGVKAKLVF